MAGRWRVQASMFHLMSMPFQAPFFWQPGASSLVAPHQDIRQMGGFGPCPLLLPHFWLVPGALRDLPFSGFWSKDAILAATLDLDTPVICCWDFVAF